MFQRVNILNIKMIINQEKKKPNIPIKEKRVEANH